MTLSVGGLVHTHVHGEEVMRKLASAGERAARRLLNLSWWEDDERSEPLPVDPQQLARGLGIKVEEEWLEPDESGRIVIPKSGQVVISVNMFDHPNRQRFTCAHEIGHYVKRRQNDDARNRTFVDYRNTLAGLGVNPDEVYANQFAAALLMPAHLVEKYYAVDDDVEALAQQFGTSVQALELRLRNLGLR